MTQNLSATEFADHMRAKRGPRLPAHKRPDYVLWRMLPWAWREGAWREGYRVYWVAALRTADCYDVLMGLPRKHHRSVGMYGDTWSCAPALRRDIQGAVAEDPGLWPRYLKATGPEPEYIGTIVWGD